MTPNNSRPISVSSVFTTIYEALLKSKIDFHSMLSNNQFGYKNFTSCKHAYYIVNETINYYERGNSSVHIASLDATKAFDKFWRAGLFQKVIHKIDNFIWRAIVSYYDKSKIVVKRENQKSKIYKTTEGVKQGGILSGFLLNFYMNGMIETVLT